MDTNVTTVRGIEPIERETIRRASRRLMPLIMLSMFCAFLDRSNVGMAAPTMAPDLGFSNAVFGSGAGMFFIGYFLAEVPSNLLLNKVGARRWIARIMMTWGIISGLTAFVWSDWSFYSVRFFLGLAEAGFGPGVTLYLIWWFPSAYRTRMQSLYQCSATMSLIIGPPIGGLLLHLDGILGLAGWQWLFITEAVPAVLMCFVVWQLLIDKPADATWLTPDQKAWLIERLASERAQREAIRKFSLAEVFYNPKLWLLSLAYVGINSVSYVMTFFLPLMVQGLGVSTNMIGVVTALPFAFSFVAMLCWGWHSDRTGERVWHVAGPCLLCAASLAICIIIGGGHPVVTMIALILATVGQQIVVPIFWAVPGALLTGTAVAAGLAWINSIGNLGGFFGPSVFGLVKDMTGSNDIALLCLALAPVISAILMVVVGHDRRLERISPRS